MSDTPETQKAVLESNGQWSFVLKECCERLERERDEAREALKHIEEYGTDEINAAVELRQKLAQTLIERDEARRKLNDLNVTVIHSCHNECQRPICVLRRERDEAREVLERIARASMSVRHKEEDYVEWEKAVESLLGICEENNFTNE